MGSRERRRWVGSLATVGLGLAVSVGCRSDLDNAIHRNDQGSINDLLRDRGNLNEPDKQGYPPIVYAAREGRVTAVRILIDHGANVDATDKDGSTALMYAADHNRVAIAQMLLDKGANPNVINTAGRTALGFAEDGHHVEVVDLLKAHGAK